MQEEVCIAQPIIVYAICYSSVGLRLSGRIGLGYVWLRTVNSRAQIS
jgi:hypothetical protein